MKTIASRWKLACILCCLAGVSHAAESLSAQPMTIDKAWLQPPKVEEAADFKAEGVRAVFYDGVPYHGKPTRVFAYLGMPKIEPGKRVPAMVLIHGGGGTAFDNWVRLWTSRGYAAIAMDTCGAVPRGKSPKWERDAMGGPPGWGGFDAVDEAPQDQWTYHAVADVILGHSLLRAQPEVDPDRIGLTGISWGGYLTCIVAGLDDRFKCAAPVYGCGFLGDNSTWLGDFKKMGPEKSARWLAMWDPSHYLQAARLPMLWVDGTNDFAYPLDSLQKSYRLPPGERTLCTRVRMPHGHPPGQTPEEIHAFAEQILREGKPLAKVAWDTTAKGQATAKFDSQVPIVRAELNYTTDAGEWQKRKWETVPATIDAGHHEAKATLPSGATVYYINVIDERGLVVSTEHVEVQAPEHGG